MAAAAKFYFVISGLAVAAHWLWPTRPEKPTWSGKRVWRWLTPLLMWGGAALLVFLMGYSEFAIGWLFIERSENATLSMALWGVRSLGAVPWSQLAALALMMSLPIVIIFIALQRVLYDRLTIAELKS